MVLMLSTRPSVLSAQQSVTAQPPGSVAPAAPAAAPAGTHVRGGAPAVQAPAARPGRVGGRGAPPPRAPPIQAKVKRTFGQVMYTYGFMEEDRVRELERALHYHDMSDKRLVNLMLGRADPLWPKEIKERRAITRRIGTPTTPPRARALPACLHRCLLSKRV